MYMLHVTNITMEQCSNVVASVTANRFPIVAATNRGKVMDLRDADLCRKVMSWQEDANQKVVRLNPNAQEVFWH